MGQEATSRPLFEVAAGRLESALPDDKPLYTDAEARAEADRCLYCVDAPCVKACPTSIDIPTFIKKIASGNVRGSARTIFDQNMLGYSCARVCPVEVLCAGACVYQEWHGPAIAIGRLQRYATETATRVGQPALFHPKTAKVQRSVALIGSGPASLACAASLALEGHRAVILEKRAVVGGLNSTGIAPYKLHVEDALHEAAWVAALGVEIRVGAGVGPAGIRGATLLSEYDAVFIGVGLGADSRLNIPGEDGAGVVGATAWIEAMKLAASGEPRSLGRVVIVGGGNTAIDMARECARLGAAEVTMVYRRELGDMSGYEHEREAAQLEGVRLIPRSVPVAFRRDPDGKLTGLSLARTDGGHPVAGTEQDIPCDLVGLAIGQAKVREIADELPGVTLDARGCVLVDAATYQTGNPKVYAGGDCVNGGKEVVNAVAAGRDAAHAMLRLWDTGTPNRGPRTSAAEASHG
jgi:glutamate synthase (NADPH/NADH) small chain